MKIGLADHGGRFNAKKASRRVGVRLDSVVYGYIQDFSGSDALRAKENISVVTSLPDPEELTLLNKGMFSSPQHKTALGDSASYLIPFGACYEGIEYEWNSWMKSFESLLRQLYWVDAVVHLETPNNGRHSFNWLLEQNEHLPGQDIHASQLEWVHEGI